MSTVTPTLIPRLPALPLLLPIVPTPHPIPLPPTPAPGGLHIRRSLRAELEELSAEEEEVETQWKEAVQNRGFNYLRIPGRLLTRQEEKNDQAETESEETGSFHSGSNADDVSDQEPELEPEPERDLDASMEDLDR